MRGSQQDGISRRQMLGTGATSLAGLSWLASLQSFNQRAAHGSTIIASPYGPIAPVNDLATGLPLIQLPSGFTYRSYGWTGDMMSDGVRTPALHDGMDVVATTNNSDGSVRGGGNPLKGGNGNGNGAGRYQILVRNHEVANGSPFVNNPEITFLNDGGGGTTNVVFDQQDGVFTRAWSTLTGTVRNCAGGTTPWGTWLTGEETTVPGHGYMFEVGPAIGDPTPLVAMGRFSHEAAAIDPNTGWVYETEDANECGLFRFIPNTAGDLSSGGQLSMLKVSGSSNVNLGGAFPLGTSWPVEWVPIANPDTLAPTCFQQGFAQGGAIFRRLEGIWQDNRGRGKGHRTNMYIVATDGGQSGEGQVFHYDPGSETITLLYDSPGQSECENPDNITVTPRGGLILCEDNAGPTTNDAERLLGLTLDGNAFTFAKNNIVLTAGQIAAAGKTVAPNNYRQNEWAGACFSTNGRWLLVNIQTPGITFAITGPWENGPL